MAILFNLASEHEISHDYEIISLVYFGAQYFGRKGKS